MINERIVVFTKNWLGDVIFEEPFIRVLKQIYPSSQIYCVTHYRCRSIIETHPQVSGVICFDERTADRSIIRKIMFVKKLRALHLTKAFILHRSFTRAFLLFCAGIPMRVGFRTSGRTRLLTHALPEPDEPLHRVDYFLSLLKGLGVYAGETGLAYRFYVTDKDKQSVRDLLARAHVEPGSYVVINPGANWPNKRWPTKHFAQLADLLRTRFHLPVVISGTTEDKALYRDLVKHMHTEAPISFCGMTGIREAGALFSFARLVISADSGPLHIAGGVGTPVVALFGPTDPRVTGPRGANTHITLSALSSDCLLPCFNDACQTCQCIRDITPDAVIQAIVDNKLL